MRRNGNLHIVRPFSDRKWLLPFIGSLLVSITLFFAFFFRIFSSPYGEKSTSVDLLSFGKIKESSEFFVESNFKLTNGDSRKEAPRIAYLISGTKGDSQRMRRTLKAIYHPRNQYILHLDLEAPPRERINLTMSIKVDPTFREVGNVRVMAQSNLVTYRGPTMIAATLQAVAILLKESSEWDWFINLSASDYPLVTQDDLLHVFSNLSRGLNFIEHSELSGWKVNQRAKSIIVDPGLYLSKKSDIFTTSRHRSLPTSFKLFAGSAWVLLTRSFLEFCIWGWDNLPRKVLMYYTNFVSSPEGYFHTVICNAEEFKKTAISHDLHYIAWDSPPKQHPRILTIKDFNDMVQSGAPFARKFTKNDPVLDKIDRELLKRSEEQFVPGAWCIGRLDTDEDPCLLRGNSSVFQPGPGAERLRGLVQMILSENPEKKRCGS